MEFKLSRLTSYEDKDLLEEMHRVAKLLGDEPLTKNRYDELSRVHSSTIGRRFGGWKKALKLAGLEDRWGQHSSFGASSDEVLAELKGVAAKLGKQTVSKTEFDEHSSFGYGSVVKRFGSWTAAIKAAGLLENPLGRRYSDEECFENLFNVWISHGRPPQYREMRDYPSEISGKPYLRFGSWTKALHRFVEWTESDRNQSSEPISTDSRYPQTPELNGRSKPARSRDIPLGLRFKVLHRDNFKCALCGNSPATDPTCKLHVDHILPFSRGGETRENNLRSLCHSCNIGRSNKYDE